ncbi:hypothetical protein BN2497_12155 [Janthinobacterium sp. CG23_2]|nr:hypothetical protein BN2497_12155 [Janthinobacterium sp. CG23_2]CUU32475.1 hypothetical protein BN3177_12155 [Janthinobacterium sp. CG23_2]
MKFCFCCHEKERENTGRTAAVRHGRIVNKRGYICDNCITY